MVVSFRDVCKLYGLNLFLKKSKDIHLYPRTNPDIPEAETYSRSEVYRCIETNFKPDARDLVAGKLERRYTKDE